MGTTVRRRGGSFRGGVALVFLAMVSVPGGALSQTAESGTRIWLAPGVGAGLMADTDPAALLLEMGVLRGNLRIGARIAGLTEAGTGNDGSAWDLGVVAGPAVRGRLGHAAVGAGLAVAGCHNRREAPKCDGTSTVGVALMAEAAFRILPFMGVGLQAFGDLNGNSTFGGLVAFVQLGLLRR